MLRTILLTLAIGVAVATTGCRCAVAITLYGDAEALLEAPKDYSGNSIDGELNAEADALGL